MGTLSIADGEGRTLTCLIGIRRPLPQMGEGKTARPSTPSRRDPSASLKVTVGCRVTCWWCRGLERSQRADEALAGGGAFEAPDGVVDFVFVVDHWRHALVDVCL